jgi:hypothetical protein
MARVTPRYGVHRLRHRNPQRPIEIYKADLSCSSGHPIPNDPSVYAACLLTKPMTLETTEKLALLVDALWSAFLDDATLDGADLNTS